MDPLSQGTLGSLLAQSLTLKKKHLKWATVLGCLGGMAPDLDVLIRSDQDPLLFLEYHRHFTHSLIFIPIGGLICSLVLYFILSLTLLNSTSLKKHLSFKHTYYYTTLGYATHALLDACTTYGTRLFWPFSDMRVAWNNVSVIDPLFTLPLLILLALAYIKKKRMYSICAIFYAVIYLLLGVVQRERAESIGFDIALDNQHQIIRLEARPSFGNILLWKIIYETKDSFFIYGVKLGFEVRTYESKTNTIKKLSIPKDLPWLEPNSKQYKDIKRFVSFSGGYVSIDPSRKNVIVDVRFSSLPQEIKPLWGIKLYPEKQDQHVEYVTFTPNPKETLPALLKMIFR